MMKEENIFLLKLLRAGITIYLSFDCEINYFLSVLLLNIHSQLKLKLDYS
jgi:hypothetical protein